MAQDRQIPQSIKDWKEYFTNRQNTFELSQHGGGSKLDWFIELTWKQPNTLSNTVRQMTYANMVQDILNRWNELATIERESYETNPITTVAEMAFVIVKDSERVMNENLRPYYNRIWRESPRPHDDCHRYLAINSRGQLPVSPTEICLLFQQSGWALVALRLASDKKQYNPAADMLQEILTRKREEIDIWLLKELVDSGFSKLKAMRIARLIEDKELTAQTITQWEQELIATGFTEAEVFAHL